MSFRGGTGPTGMATNHEPAHRRTPPVIRLLALATFVVILNETVMINAIPRLMADLNVPSRRRSGCPRRSC